jgi:hypothetical protein
MAGRVVPMRVGGVEVLVETIPVAGTEATSVLDSAGDRVMEAFDRAKSVISGVAASTVDVIKDIASSPVAHPDKVEVEFGLSFSAKGNVIVAGASAEATLKVTLKYQVGKPAKED